MVVVGDDVPDHGAVRRLVVKKRADALCEAAKIDFVEVEAPLAGDPETESQEVRGVAGDAVEGDAIVGSEAGAELGDGGPVEAFTTLEERAGDACGEMEVAVGSDEDEVLDFPEGRVGDPFEAGFEVGDGVWVRVGGSEKEDPLVLAGVEVELVRSVELGFDLGELFSRNGECVVFNQRHG